MDRKILMGVAAVLVLALVGGAAFLLLMNRPGPPPPTIGTTTTAEGTTTSAVPLESIEGSWEVTAEDSFVGYRVQEEFLTQDLPNQAVGRTSTVEGSMTIEGTTVTEAEVVADLRDLQSDESTRDSAIRTRGLESNEFPQATFELTEPIELDSVPGPGEVVEVEAVGDLTLHGVTNEVAFPLEAAIEGGNIHVVGSLEIAFEDYEIEPPTVAGSISVEPEGTIELDLVFERASGG